jgi:hypothetical protein
VDARGSAARRCDGHFARPIGKRTGKDSRMTATAEVERIDIKEGPNRETLVFAPELAAAFRKHHPKMVHETRFDEARFYGKDGIDMRHALEGSRMFRGQLEAIAYFGDDPFETHDFLIRVKSSLGTFVGHYNTQTRKGILMRVR